MPFLSQVTGNNDELWSSAHVSRSQASAIRRTSAQELFNSGSQVGCLKFQEVLECFDSVCSADLQAVNVNQIAQASAYRALDMAGLEVTKSAMSFPVLCNAAVGPHLSQQFIIGEVFKKHQHPPAHAKVDEDHNSEIARGEEGSKFHDVVVSWAERESP